MGRCHFPLCRGQSDHNHLKYLKYSCPETMSSTDAEIYQTSVPQPGSFICPDHFTTLVLTESGRPLLPEECVAVQQWLSKYRLWKKVPVCDENKSREKRMLFRDQNGRTTRFNHGQACPKHEFATGHVNDHPHHTKLTVTPCANVQHAWSHDTFVDQGGIL